MLQTRELSSIPLNALRNALAQALLCVGNAIGELVALLLLASGHHCQLRGVALALLKHEGR